MNLKRIHHVAYRCHDAKETVEFYQKVLGMGFVLAIAEDQVPSTKAPDPYMHVFLDAGMGNVLAFFELPNSPEMGFDDNTPDWVQHIAFELDSMDDLMEARAAVEALEACEAAIRPGKPMGEVFDAHARVFDKHGLKHARLQACGYGMGAVYNPIWVDFPMFYQGNPLEMQTGQVFFLHMILMDEPAGLAMCWGHSVLVTKDGVERLSRHPLDLVEL